MPADTQHPAFSQPTDAATPIWRYMDLAKYIALLNTQSLHFSRLDKLGDPFEGSLSKAEYKRLQELAEQGEKKGDLPVEWRGRYFDILMGSTRCARREIYVSCWHMNAAESEAMWRIYSTSAFAVAIKTTYAKLRDALPSVWSPKEHVGPFMGTVEYMDHHAEEIPTGNGFHAVMHKRLAFAHERECRAVIWRAGPASRSQLASEEELAAHPQSISVEVDLTQMIEKVIVSPLAPEWFIDTVVSSTEKFGYQIPVESSSLSLPAYY